MPEYLTPGIHVEEAGARPRAIEGAPTSIAAFLGETERGPTIPQLVTSFGDYRRHFGDASVAGKYLPDALSGFFANGGQRAFVCRIVAEGTPTAELAFGQLQLVAAGPGDWGKRIRAKLVGTGAGGAAPGFNLLLAYWQSPEPAGGYPDPSDPADARLPRPTLIEQFDGLSWDPTSDAYFARRLAHDSVLVASKPGAPPIAGAGDIDTSGTGLRAFDHGPAPEPQGGAPGLDDYRGDAERTTGLAALELDACRDVALVAAPGITDPAIVDAILAHCEGNGFRFAILDSEPHPGNVSAIDPRGRRPSDLAAYYFPWLVTADLHGGQTRLVPPSGHIIGTYASTDSAHGVWKAPANVPLAGLLDLERQLNAQQMAALNVKGVNAIRRLPDRGIVAWGARTLSSDPQWQYVSVRRLILFLERSIHEGLQWAAFEPNGEILWGQVRLVIGQFLGTLWRNGALMGTTANQAFMIACGRSTMSEDDVLNGRLICEVGVAALRPAEFIIFRVVQHTAEASA